MSNNEKVKKQVEFYFSDANFRTDKFLKQESLKNDRWIPASLILKFKRMTELGVNLKEMKSALLESEIVELKDVEDVKENQADEEVAVMAEEKKQVKEEKKENENTESKEQIEETVEEKHAEAKIEEAKTTEPGEITNVIEDDFLIRKIETEDYKNYINDPEIDKRFVVIKGINPSFKLEEIEEYLKKYFDFVLIRMRRDAKHNFKGSVFVELKSIEEVEKVVNMKIKIMDQVEESVKRQKIDGENYENTSIENYLDIKRKLEYFADKKEGREKAKVERERKQIIEQFKGRYYKYECEKDVTIDSVKKTIENVAFVDLSKKVLRFKKEQDFEEKEFEKDELKIKLTKLNEDESRDYSANIKFTGQKKVQKKRKIRK